MDGLGAAAQDDRVTCLQAEGARLDRHVRPGLVDHGDHTERHPHAPHAEAVRANDLGHELAHRVGEAAHLVDARAIASTRRRRGAAGRAWPRRCPSRGEVHVARVRVDHGGRPLAEARGDPRERGVFDVGVAWRELSSRLAGADAHVADLGLERGRRHAACTTESEDVAQSGARGRGGTRFEDEPRSLSPSIDAWPRAVLPRPTNTPPPIRTRGRREARRARTPSRP